MSIVINPNSKLTQTLTSYKIDDKLIGIPYFENRQIDTSRFDYKPYEEYYYKPLSHKNKIDTEGIYQVEFLHDNRFFAKSKDNKIAYVKSEIFNLSFELLDIINTKNGTVSKHFETIDTNFEYTDNSNKFIPTLNLRQQQINYIQNYLNEKQSIFKDIRSTSDIKNKAPIYKKHQFCEYESLPVYKLNSNLETIRFKYSQNFLQTKTCHLISPYFDIDIDNYNKNDSKKLVRFVMDLCYYFFLTFDSLVDKYENIMTISKKIVTIGYYSVNDLSKLFESESINLKEDIKNDFSDCLDISIDSSVLKKEDCEKDFSARIIFNGIKVDSLLYDAFMLYMTDRVVKILEEDDDYSNFANTKVIDTNVFNNHNQLRNVYSDKMKINSEGKMTFKKCSILNDNITVDKFLRSFVTFLNPSYEYSYVNHDNLNTEFNSEIKLNINKYIAKVNLKRSNQFIHNNGVELNLKEDRIKCDNQEMKLLIDKIDETYLKKDGKDGLKYIISMLINHHKQIEIRFKNRWAILCLLYKTYTKDEINMIFKIVYEEVGYVPDYFAKQLDNIKEDENKLEELYCIMFLQKLIEKRGIKAGLTIVKSESNISNILFVTKPIYKGEIINESLDWNGCREYIFRKYAKIENGEDIYVINTKIGRKHEYKLYKRNIISTYTDSVYVLEDVVQRFNTRKTLFKKESIVNDVVTYSVKDSTLLFEFGLANKIKKYEDIQLLSNDPYTLNLIRLPEKLEDNDEHLKLFSNIIERFIEDRITPESRHNFIDLLNGFSYILKNKSHFNRNYLMNSDVGCGKSMFVEKFMAPLVQDQSNLTLILKDLLDTKFAVLADYVIRMCNEVDSIQNPLQATSFMKQMSEETIAYEQKYIPRSIRKNIGLNIYASNDPYFGGLFTCKDDSYINRSALIIYKNIDIESKELKDKYMEEHFMRDYNTIPKDKLNSVIYTYYMNRDLTNFNKGRYEDKFTYDSIRNAKFTGRENNDALFNAFNLIDFKDLITISFINASTVNERSGITNNPIEKATMFNMHNFNNISKANITKYELRLDGTNLNLRMVNKMKEIDPSFVNKSSVTNFINAMFGKKYNIRIIRKIGSDSVNSACVYKFNLKEFYLTARIDEDEIICGKEELLNEDFEMGVKKIELNSSPKTEELKIEDLF